MEFALSLFKCSVEKNVSQEKLAPVVAQVAAVLLGLMVNRASVVDVSLKS